ncbi:MAG: nucleotide exchange factor GrpE [Oscillospiraceae bacterium]|nr:nucleotide exchange factor GrpE [Oscillospiraceae bacterium]
MSDEKKTEEVIEETQAPKSEAEEPKKDAPKEEKKEKAKKDKAEKKKEEPAAPKEEKTEPPQGQSDAYLRLLAEYDNYRKRSQREKDALYADIRADTLKQFLPVYDNLMRALNQSTADEAYRKGVEMIMAQFNKTLESLGVERIESLGKTFDPALHNAVMHVDDETKGENEIVEVFQEGFRLGDKVIRFAMVKVAN